MAGPASAPTLSNLGQVLENAETSTSISEWLANPSRYIHERLTQWLGMPSDSFSSATSERPFSKLVPNRPPSQRTTSSRAPSCICEDQQEDHAPSLYHSSEATPTESSISTGLASHFPGVPLLEAVDGVLERRPKNLTQPVFECSFWFLRCSYMSHDHAEWRTHCLSHFRGEEPPTSVQCPLCEFEYTNDNGWAAWDYRQCHVAAHHLQGQTLRTSRPDFRLFNYLWQKRLIDDQDLGDLKGGSYCYEQQSRIASKREGHAAEPELRVGVEKPNQMDPDRARSRETPEETIRPAQSMPSFDPIHDHPDFTQGSLDAPYTNDDNTKFTLSLTESIDSGSRGTDSEEESVSGESGSVAGFQYSESGSDWDHCATTINPLKQHYLTQLLSSFIATQKPPRSLDDPVDQNNSESSKSTGSGKHRASSPSGGQGGQRPNKRTNRRSKPDDNARDEEDDNNSGNAPGKTPQAVAGDDLNNDRSLACPYVKRYPHQYLKCSTHTLKTVSRVKQHLLREKAHRLPIYCPRCYKTFATEDPRDIHVRDGNCLKRPPIKWEGITSTQRQQLSKRSPSNKSDEENWNSVFRILFPDAPLPSDPYINMTLAGELRAFREHAIVQGPLIWQDILDAQLPEHLRPHLEELQSLSASFYPESMVRLCESWARRLLSQSTPGFRDVPQAEDEVARMGTPLMTNLSSHSSSEATGSPAIQPRQPQHRLRPASNKRSTQDASTQPRAQESISSKTTVESLSVALSPSHSGTLILSDGITNLPSEATPFSLVLPSTSSGFAAQEINSELRTSVNSFGALDDINPLDNLIGDEMSSYQTLQDLPQPFFPCEADNEFSWPLDANFADQCMQQDIDDLLVADVD